VVTGHYWSDSQCAALQSLHNNTTMFHSKPFTFILKTVITRPSVWGRLGVALCLSVCLVSMIYSKLESHRNFKDVGDMTVDKCNWGGEQFEVKQSTLLGTTGLTFYGPIFTLTQTYTRWTLQTCNSVSVDDGEEWQKVVIDSWTLSLSRGIVVSVEWKRREQLLLVTTCIAWEWDAHVIHHCMAAAV